MRWAVRLVRTGSPAPGSAAATMPATAISSRADKGLLVGMLMAILGVWAEYSLSSVIASGVLRSTPQGVAGGHPTPGQSASLGSPGRPAVAPETPRQQPASEEDLPGAT